MSGEDKRSEESYHAGEEGDFADPAAEDQQRSAHLQQHHASVIIKVKRIHFFK